MFQKLKAYLSKEGVNYIKAERAGDRAAEMLELKALGQAARQEFTEIAEAVLSEISPFEMTRVSNWISQAQISRPHFWCYFKAPEDRQDDVGLAIRLYGDKEAFGISVEVSFIERKKSDQTLARQHRVLDLPIAEPLYYLAQKQGKSQRIEGTEANRLRLRDSIAAGETRKVLVKYDLPITEEMGLDEVTRKLATAFRKLLPYYEASKDQETL